jgi:hypothetical protein
VDIQPNCIPDDHLHDNFLCPFALPTPIAGSDRGFLMIRMSVLCFRFCVTGDCLSRPSIMFFLCPTSSTEFAFGGLDWGQPFSNTDSVTDSCFRIDTHYNAITPRDCDFVTPSAERSCIWENQIRINVIRGATVCTLEFFADYWNIFFPFLFNCESIRRWILSSIRGV